MCKKLLKTQAQLLSMKNHEKNILETDQNCNLIITGVFFLPVP